MADTWYILKNGRQYGPMTGAQLKQSAASNRLAPKDCVRRSDQDEWIPASRIRGLFPPPLPNETPPRELRTGRPFAAGLSGLRTSARRYWPLVAVAGGLTAALLLVVSWMVWTKVQTRPRPEGWVESITVQGVEFRPFDDDTALGRLQISWVEKGELVALADGKKLAGAKVFRIECDGNGWIFAYDDRGRPLLGSGYDFHDGKAGGSRHGVSCGVELDTRYVSLAIVDDPAHQPGARDKGKRLVLKAVGRPTTKETADILLTVIGYLDRPQEPAIVNWLAELATTGVDELFKEEPGGGRRISGKPSTSMTAWDAMRASAAAKAFVYSGFAPQHRAPVEGLLGRAPEVRAITLSLVLHACIQTRAAVPEDVKEWIRQAGRDLRLKGIQQIVPAGRVYDPQPTLAVLTQVLDLIPREHQWWVVRQMTETGAYNPQASEAVRRALRAWKAVKDPRLNHANAQLWQELQSLDPVAWAEELRAQGRTSFLDSPAQRTSYLAQVVGEGKRGLARRLLQRGVAADQRVVLAAAYRVDLDMMKVLLEFQVDLRAADTNKRTALHVAAQQRLSEALPVVAFLLDQGLDVNARDAGGRTPLHEAIGPSPKVVELLLVHQADVNATTADGQTPLHLAARGYEEAARLLLDHGALVNARRKTDGLTPLDIAKKASKPALIQLLVRRGGK